MSIEYVRQITIKVAAVDFDAVFDALPDYYYGSWWGRRFWTPAICSESSVITISHLPRLPRRLHLRAAARVCARALRERGVQGWADLTYQRVLEVWEDGRD